MLTYKQFDFIADLYIPVLALISFYFLVVMYRFGCASKALNNMVLLGLSIVFIYLVMFVDKYFLIWHTLNLDYSTHTALALVFVVFLALKGFRLLIFGLVSMFLYAGLMVFQNYHSVLDIVTTGGVVTPVLMLILSSKLLTSRHSAT